MPSHKPIIFLRDKSGAFKLRDDIKAYWQDDKTGYYSVTFTHGDKPLSYKPSNIDIATFKRQLEPPFRIVRTTDGEVFCHVLGVYYFKGIANAAYRVVFENGDIKNYPDHYLSIEEHIDDFHSICVWEYLNEISKYNVIPIDDDKSVSLSDKFAKMAFVPKNSLLESYLNVDTYSNPEHKKRYPIFPFGCNRSQYKAVNDALQNKLSVIQGPPGTGKTQTILNIMANLLIEGKSMEIVSNNNSAVENIKEKLESYGFDFICAQLGRASHKKEFLNHQSGVYPSFDGWKMKDGRSAYNTAVDLSRELQTLYEYQEKYASDTELLKDYHRQIERFPISIDLISDRSSKRLKVLLHRCERDLDERHRFSIITKLLLFIHRLPFDDSVVDIIHYHFLKVSAKELSDKCNWYKQKISCIDEKNQSLQDLSLQVLKSYLARTYGNQNERTVFSAEDIYKRSKAFLQEYPVVLSTTFSATSNINPYHKFDYLIMDEASQVDIAAGALALSCANNAVIVGDLKQLPNVVDSHSEEVSNAVFSKYDLSDAYKFASSSFLSSVCRLYPRIPQTLLKEHYRCDPLIIGFCSKQFYNGELIPMRQTGEDCVPIRVVRTVAGNHARGTVNRRQVDVILNEIIPELEAHFSDIGIIAPYNNQVDAISVALKNSGKNYIAATVHKFQGRENDAIILSTVDNQIKEFTDDPHLLNVAVSRAKKQFTLIVSGEEQPDSNIRDLIDYIEYYTGAETQSKVSSIFDLLYENHTRDMLEFYRTHKRLSDFDSENIAYWATRDVIDKLGLSHLSVVLHYPLRHLITSSSVLTDEQRTYSSHTWTHIDLLVYDTVSHKAKLAIEVDGTQFHKRESKQKQRDNIKDSVLESIGIPLLRLSTDGSDEKERITKALSSQLA